MRERYRFGRALGVENIPAIPAVVFPVRKTKCGPAAHTHVGIDPFWGLACHQHLAGFKHGSGLTALLSSILLDISVLGGNRKPSLCSVL